MNKSCASISVQIEYFREESKIKLQKRKRTRQPKLSKERILEGKQKRFQIQVAEFVERPIMNQKITNSNARGAEFSTILKQIISINRRIKRKENPTSPKMKINNSSLLYMFNKNHKTYYIWAVVTSIV